MASTICQKRLGTAAPTPVPNPGGNCDDGWSHLNSMCYKEVSGDAGGSMNFQAARR
jgi:hypothetical protein